MAPILITQEGATHDYSPYLRIQKNVSLSLRNWEDALADCLQLIQANDGL